LLLLSIFLRFQKAILPHKRLDVYEEFVNSLVRDHPAHKQAAASLATPMLQSLSVEDVRRVLAFVAYEAHRDYPEGLMPELWAQRRAEHLLRDDYLGLGLAVSEAKARARDFVDVAEGSLGILVRQGDREIGFFHRSLQEYLAADHIDRLPIAEQKAIVETRCLDQRWKDVILAVLWHKRRAEDFDLLLAPIQNATEDTVDGPVAEEILAEIGFGDFPGATVRGTKALADHALAAIEEGEWPARKERMVRYAFDGLRSTSVGEIVRERIGRWIFAAVRWRHGAFEHLRHWPKDELTVSTLFAGLRDEDISAQLSAAMQLGSMFADDDDIGDRIAKRASRALDVQERTAALTALGQGWRNRSDLIPLLNEAHLTDSPEIRVAAVLGRIALGQRNRDDLEELLRQGVSGDGLGYEWRGHIATGLLEGWKGDARLKEACLQRAGAISLNQDLAFTLLLKGFPQDNDVAEFFADQFRSDKHFGFSELDHLEWLARNFRDHPLLVPAIDRWATEQPKFEYRVALVALVGRTPKLKALLLERLAGAFPHWAARSLIDGWGIDDRDVVQALRAEMAADSEHACEIANFIPLVLPRSEARSRLCEMLRDRQCKRPDFVLDGLASFATAGDDPDVVELALPFLSSETAMIWGGVLPRLMVNYSRNSRVREIAISALGKREPPVESACQAYPHDQLVRKRIAELLTPLPTDLRAVLVAGLAERATEADDFVTELLARYDVEEAEEVKVLGAIHYHERIRRPETVAGALDTLRTQLSAVGFDHEARRAAAFAALLTLKRIDVFSDHYEALPSEQRFRVRVGDWRGPNLPLVRAIATHWQEVVRQLGPDPTLHLGGDPGEFWSSLAGVAADYPSVQPFLDEALRASPSLVESASGLAYIAARRPRSTLLLESCLAALEPTPGTYNRPVLLAARLLARTFGGDSSALALLAAKPISWAVPGKVLALALGWPQHEALDTMYAHLQRQDRTPVPMSAAIAVVYSRISASELFAHLEAHLSTEGIGRRIPLASWMREVVVARLKRDPTAAGVLSGRLGKELSPSMKASLPRLFAESACLGTEQRAWTRAELVRQLSAKSPQIGYDVVSGTSRTIALSLRDALSGE